MLRFVLSCRLHLCYHAPENSWLGKLPGLAYLREHHRVHHSQALMRNYNFNITYPLMDLLFRTTYQGKAD
jgi:sterol desaturase/sphingolipid hydroxylase (fatty acid hydroxylase superfamily)